MLNATFVPIVYFLFPETGSRSLEQIDDIFEGKGQGWSGLTQGVRESTRNPLIENATGIGGHRDVVEVAHIKREEGPTTANVEDAAQHPA